MVKYLTEEQPYSSIPLDEGQKAFLKKLYSWAIAHDHLYMDDDDADADFIVDIFTTPYPTTSVTDKKQFIKKLYEKLSSKEVLTALNKADCLLLLAKLLKTQPENEKKTALENIYYFIASSKLLEQLDSAQVHTFINLLLQAPYISPKESGVLQDIGRKSLSQPLSSREIAKLLDALKKIIFKA